MKIPYSALLFVIAITLLVISTIVFAADLAMEEEPIEIPNEKEVKKMKVKDLKTFLTDRGVPCEACTEKGDYVKKVLANLQTPLLPSKRKLKPKGEFWEFWAGLSKSVCNDAASKKNVDGSAAICDAVGAAVDSFFMQHGKRTAAKLKKKPANLLKTSVGEPYQGAGRRLIGKLVEHCLKSGSAGGACASSSKVTSLLEGNKVKNVDFQKWITNVGIENTNPMYEAMKDKSLNADL